MRWLALTLTSIVVAASSMAFAVDAPTNFMFQEPPQQLPEIQFMDEVGGPHSLQEFRGEVVLLNIWATWCIPCRKEMPALDRLQAKLGGKDFEVVALSIDRGGPSIVKKFYGQIGIQHLPLRIDVSSKVLRDVGAAGLPTTLLIDRQGLELGRLTGPAEWDSPDTLEFLKSLISQKTGAAAPRQKETRS